MISTSINRLQLLCINIPALFEQISEQEFSLKPDQNKWSKKEILGHLIDSATNNHQRFVRGQFEETPHIVYDQNKWNECSYYQHIHSQQLISFWEAYNKQLLELIKQIPQDKLNRTVNTGTQNYTLAFLIDDYVVHLEHHLKQLVNY